ncbi:MAG: TetR/AcrR family transcriptional regulator [Sandaracinus sp.]|nr:TetR/AcrR family transcriptional regulator [Sandaracinus sp.]
MARTRLTRRTKRRDPDDAKARILEAALSLFSAEGVSVPTSRIAKEAGVSEGLVFHHYGNKRGLLAAVAAHMGHGVASAMFEGLLPGQRPDVRRMIRACFDYVGRNGKLHDMLAMSNDPGDWNAAMMATRGVIVAALTQAFTQWKAAGYIETDHPDIAATLIFGLVDAALMDCFSRGQEARVDAYVEEAVACIEGALGYEGPDA